MESGMGGLLQRLEYATAFRPRLRRLYGEWFYRRLVAREIDLAGIAPGSRVLHIGCGPAPHTACFLASAGMRVTAVDRDAEAIKTAARILERSGDTEKIELLHRNGIDIDLEGFQAVWLSLHIEPKEELIRKLYSRMSPGTVIIYRNPRGWLRLFYQTNNSWFAQTTRKNIFSKASVLIHKPSSIAPVSLSCLGNGDCGTIIEAPPMPLLSSLGCRPGKQIRVKHQGLLNGPLIVEVEGRNSALAVPVAEQIKVEPAA